MTGYQYIMIAIAVALILSVVWEPIKQKESVKNFINRFLSLFNQDPHTPKPNGTKESLVSIVGGWEDLKESCKRLHLNQAAKELDKIFPLLVVCDHEEDKKNV